MHHFICLVVLSLLFSPCLYSQSDIEQRLKEAVIKRLPEAFHIPGTIKDVEFISYYHAEHTKRSYAEQYLFKYEHSEKVITELERLKVEMKQLGIPDTVTQQVDKDIQDSHKKLRRKKVLESFLTNTEKTIYRYSVDCRVGFSEVHPNGSEKQHTFFLTEQFDASFETTCEDGECLEMEDGDSQTPHRID